MIGPSAGYVVVSGSAFDARAANYQPFVTAVFSDTTVMQSNTRGNRTVDMMVRVPLVRTCN